MSIEQYFTLENFLYFKQKHNNNNYTLSTHFQVKYLTQTTRHCHLTHLQWKFPNEILSENEPCNIRFHQCLLNVLSIFRFFLNDQAIIFFFASPKMTWKFKMKMNIFSNFIFSPFLLERTLMMIATVLAVSYVTLAIFDLEIFFLLLLF